MVSDKTIHKAFYLEVIQFYKQNPLKKFEIFTIYHNYTFGFKLYDTII